MGLADFGDDDLAIVLYTIGVALLIGLLFCYLWCTRAKSGLQESIEAWNTGLPQSHVWDDQELGRHKSIDRFEDVRESTDHEAILRAKEREAWKKVEDEFTKMYEAARARRADEDAKRRLEEEEARQRAAIAKERNFRVECWSKYRERCIRWIEGAGKQTGSLGLKVGQRSKKLKELKAQGISDRALEDRGRFPPYVRAVGPGSAGDKCRLTRSDGSPLPEEEQKLKAGDLIMKVTVPAGTQYEYKYKHKPDQEPYYGGVEWPVFHRENHLMRAVGALGGVWDDTTFTMWIVRDQDFIKRWEVATDAFIDAGGKFVKMDRFYESPFAEGVTPPIPFPRPKDEILLKAEVTMQPRSANAQEVLKKSLRKLSSFSSSGTIDHDMLYNIQSNDPKSKVYIREVMDRFDANKNGKLEVDEMYEVHKAIAQECGINCASKNAVCADFDEADVNGDGQLEFDEFYFYLREQIVNATFEMEDTMRTSGHLKSMAVTGMEMSGASMPTGSPTNLSPRSDGGSPTNQSPRSDQEGASLLGAAR